MKIYWLHLLFLLVFPLQSTAQETGSAPLQVINKRTQAIKDQDLSAFVATYADDVAFFVYPDKPLASGKEHLKKLFAPLFKKGDMEIKVIHQSASDSFVVYESIFSFADKSEATLAIYEVRNGLIQSVRFLRDDLRARQTARISPEHKANIQK